METELTRMTYRREKPGRSFRWFLLILLLLFISSSLAGLFIWDRYYPNHTYEHPNFQGMDKPIFLHGLQLDVPAIGAGEQLKLPFSVIKQYIDPTIHLEEKTNSVIITTQDKVVKLQTDQLTAMINERPFELRFPVEKHDGLFYLPIDPLYELYGLQVEQSAETGAVLLYKAGDALQQAHVRIDEAHPDRTIAMRNEPSIKATIAADLPQNEALTVWNDAGEWVQVQLANGFMGYVRKNAVVFDPAKIVSNVRQQPAFIAWKPLGGKIVMTWEQVENKTPNTDGIGKMAGLNVVSPTWFTLLDGDGTLRNTADPAYVEWAHSNQFQVWALVSNGFEPNRTTQALASYETRMKIISQLVSFAKMYQLQGINVDFENVYLADKDNFTQFIREMTPILHEQGLVVSVDVTFKSNSEMWSMFYDRSALAEVVDYVMVMAYDEFWASSPVAGSVSSLPWVEKSLRRIIEEDAVPVHKIVLGVPLYTRIWTETAEDGETKLSSRAVYMDTALDIVKDKQLTPVYLEDAGQNFVEYTEGEKTNKIWLEDDVSMKARIELVRKYHLAGVAAWQRVHGNEHIWDVISQTLEQRP